MENKHYFIAKLDDNGNVIFREEITIGKAEGLWVKIHYNSYVWSEYALTPREIFDFSVDNNSRVHTYLGYPSQL